MRSKLKLERDTVWLVKAIVIAAVLGLLLWFIVWLTDNRAGAAQPPTRDLVMLLSYDGLVLDGQSGTFIGVWQAQNLSTERGQRGQIRAIHTVTNGGENLLFAYKRQPPTRTGRVGDFKLAVIEFPGSEWIPLSDTATGWEQDGFVLGIAVKVYLAK